MTKFLKESFRNGNRFTNIVLSILVPIIVAGILWLGGKMDKIYTLSIEHELRLKAVEASCMDNHTDIKSLENDLKNHKDKQQ